MRKKIYKFEKETKELKAKKILQHELNKVASDLWCRRGMKKIFIDTSAQSTEVDKLEVQALVEAHKRIKKIIKEL